MTLLFSVMLGTASVCSAGAATGSENGLGYSLTPSKTLPYTPCPPSARSAECNIIVDPPAVRTADRWQLPSGGPLLEGSGEMGGYDPSDLQSAYGIPATGGTGETVALVEADGYAAAEADLAKYREKYGLSACTKANGCFKKVNQKGEEKNYPTEENGSWVLETALDMDMVSAACSSCHILVVEANTEAPKDTAASAEEAATLKATEISNSYGYPENNETLCPAKKGCAEFLAAYKHAGIPVTASSGDSGYDDKVGAPSWPATSPDVIAVGGTNLNKAANSRGWAESTWKGSGSGCSLYEAKPAWQLDTGCAKRADNDVAAVSATETPVSIYSGGWFNIAGTSVAAPLVAAIEAHSESATKTAGAEAFYKHPGMLSDVTAGFNGTCTPPVEDAYLCTAGVGYDGPTGWGTPNGIPHTSGWFTRALPSLPVGPYAKGISLTSVSCLTESCVAVGHYTNSTGAEAPLAERWSATSKAWEALSIAAPTGAKSASLTGVSCRGAEVCVAVGRYLNSAGTELAFAAEFTAGSQAWETQAVPNPTGTKSSTLTGVSCAEKCIAVGHYVTSSGVEETLALVGEEVSFKRVWGVTASLNAKEAKSTSLTGVSCPAGEGLCLAVGHYLTAAGVELTFSEVWFFNKWSIQTAVNPAEAKSSSLSGVSCAGGECIAVGHYVSAAGKELTLVEHWTFETEKWTIQESPSPAEAKGASLASVSCHEAETCTAAGQYVSSAGTELTLVEVLTKATKKWAVQESVNPAGAKSAALAGVSCSGAEACTAAGHYVNSSSATLTLAEAFTSATKKWALQEPVNPKEAAGNLPGVSCTAAEACTAVGHSLTNAGAEVTLGERWNGKEWALQETPNPTGAKNSSLSSVSCTAAEACTAVGRYVNSGGTEVTLAEAWSSKKWAVQETPNPTGAKSSSLSGVSCTAAEACTAVGHYVTSGGVEETLAEVFTSTAKKWAIQETPNPAGAKSSSLSGVSCTAAEACTAVGHYVTSGGIEVTLGEVFTSTAKKWAVQEPPNPAGAKSSSLSGVSCTAAEACTAVGHYVTSGSIEVTLGEVFTSTAKKWAIQETPNPAEAKSSSLSSVSCKTATACMAAGHELNGAGSEAAMVEEHA